MDIISRQKDNVVILFLEGDINIDSSNFIEAVGSYLNNGITDILCDFTKVNIVDYTGLSVLAIVYKNVAGHHGRMKFVNVPLHIKNIFSAVCLDNVFEIYADYDEAMESFKEDKKISEIQKKQLRRRFKRLPIMIPAKFKVKDSQDRYAQEGKLYNLSAIGAFILCQKTYALGTAITLKLKLYPETEALLFDARVIWISRKELMPRLYPGIGIEFHDIGSELQKKIISFVDRNLPSGKME